MLGYLGGKESTRKVMHHDWYITGDIDLEKLCKEMSESELPKLWLPKKSSYYQVYKIPVLGSGILDSQRIKSVPHFFTSV
ncbi:MAG: hypothetical protein SCALA701_23950 [Candidatus Scalindua sp.]|nr:MAG: hypothetical protein SCALA701_23950 [Candidatus Scalindua sp.]